MTLEEADTFVRRVIAEDDFRGLVSLYIFGSVAEGRAHRESDLDIGVLLDRRVYPSKNARFQQRLLVDGVVPRGRSRGRCRDSE